jgi:hypothetical protein
LIVLFSCSTCAQPSPSDADTLPLRRPSDQQTGSATEQDKDSIRQQIARNWVVDVGIPGLENMEARLDIELNPDGSVRSATIDPTHEFGDPNWAKFAESCRRAVLKSSPLQMPSNIPYEEWKQMTLTFSGRAMFSNEHDQQGTTLSVFGPG